MKTLGRYRVEKILHRGGMGEILLAKTDCPGGFARQVVIKRLKGDLVDDPVIRTLFEREAYLLARLHHPNIVRASDYFFDQNAPHLVLEYIHGRNLRSAVHQARRVNGLMPVRYSLFVVAQLLRGLHYMHHARDDDGRPLEISHRDICPANVMVSYFGEVKVADFGIASMAGAERLTGPGFFRGKVQYASPEQVSGEGFGVASDIYSAGVVLAEMLSGKSLFGGQNVGDTVRLVLTENRERTIDRILEDIGAPGGLRTALRGALAVSPADRFASALQFAEALEAISRLQSLQCTPAQLGLFLRRVYDGEADLPVDDIFDWNAGAVPSFVEDSEPTPIPTVRTRSPIPAPRNVVERSRTPPPPSDDAPKKKGLLSWLPFDRNASVRLTEKR